MTAINQNVTHWAGDSRVLRITVKDLAGDPIDLTGASIRWWLGRTVASTGDDIFVQKDSDGNGITVDHPSTFWRVIITLDPIDTEGLPAGRWYHECEVVDVANAVSTVTIGKFEIKPTLIPDEL